MEAALKLASWNRWDADDWNLHFAANPKRERIHMAQARKLEQGQLPGNKARHEFEPEKPGGRVGN